MYKNNRIYLIALLLSSLIWACEKEDMGDIVPDEETEEDTAGITVIDSDYTVASVMADNEDGHESETDYSWESASEMDIILNGNSITTNAPGVVIEGSLATITAAGNYRITGSLADGQIVVDTEEEDVPVRLILDGVNIHHSSNAPLFIAGAEKTIIVLKDGTENYLSDGSTYTYDDPEEDEPDATLFSKDDLSIYGNGKLTVTANYNDGITSKDGLVIASGNITVTAKDDGIRGKDYLIINSGSFTIDAQGDGLKSTNDEEAALGYVYIKDGDFVINSGTDGIQGETDVLVHKGTFDIVSGGGAAGNSTEDSSKGLKAGVHLVIDSGDFELDNYDDALHSNNNLCVNAGSFRIATKDDGIHADSTISINGGTIDISTSYEGIESQIIVINAGEIHVKSSDDGLNVAGGNDSSAGGHFPGSASSSTDYYLVINGGYIYVNAAGDGLDANGSIEMNGGVVLVDGPTAQNNGALDYDRSFRITGGLLAAAGSANMAQAPGTTSTQNSVLVRFSSNQSANSLVNISAAGGTELITFRPAKNFQSLVFSSPELETGSQYTVYYGGSHSGTEKDGLYSEGSYSAGTTFADFTVSSAVTRVQ